MQITYAESIFSEYATLPVADIYGYSLSGKTKESYKKTIGYLNKSFTGIFDKFKDRKDVCEYLKNLYKWQAEMIIKQAYQADLKREIFDEDKILTLQEAIQNQDHAITLYKTNSLYFIMKNGLNKNMVFLKNIKEIAKK